MEKENKKLGESQRENYRSIKDSVVFSKFGQALTKGSDSQVKNGSGVWQEWDIRSGRIEIEVGIRGREFERNRIKNLA